MSRLTIEMTDQQHQSIKASAALQGKSIEEYALERLIPTSTNEDAALRELKAILEQRMSESAGADVLARSLTEIAEDVIKDGGPA
ncbi:MAG: antitoxin [Burkholderiaceae bacterium]|nr:antitoxin [Burkholderiaceae bacterium]